MKLNKKRWPQSIYGIGTEPDPRNSLANERTALAGLRTALALVASSLAIVAILHYFEESASLLKLAAIVLAVSGGFLAITSVRHWVYVEKALRLKQPLPSPNGLVTVSLFIAIIAIITIVSIFTK